jgi:hypothetical protein
MQSEVGQLKNPGAASVWSGYASCFCRVDDTLAGPLGCWVHIDTDGNEGTKSDLVKLAFENPKSYSFFD